MVLDADARRSRAVNRLAKWLDRAERWPGPLGRYARGRVEPARQAVERCATDDVAECGHLALIVAPRRITEQRAAAYYAALAHYRAAVMAATTEHYARTAFGDPAEPEGVRRAPGAAEVRGPGRRRGRGW